MDWPSLAWGCIEGLASVARPCHFSPSWGVHIILEYWPVTSRYISVTFCHILALSAKSLDFTIQEWTKSFLTSPPLTVQSRWPYLILSPTTKQIQPHLIRHFLHNPRTTQISPCNLIIPVADTRSTFHCPTDSCRNDWNPPESSGIWWNGTGILRNPQEWDRNLQDSNWNTQEWLYSCRNGILYIYYIVNIVYI